MSEKLETSSLYEQLREAIVRGQIPQGARIREVDLANEFSVGRGPIRDALQKLQSQQLIIKEPNVGAQVVEFNREELKAIYQVRENLEALACQLAAINMTDNQLNALAEILEHHRQYVEDSSGLEYIDQDPDLDFHLQIIHGSGNQWLARILCDELYHRVRMYRYQSSHQKTRPIKALVEHQRIYDALRDRDGELAALLMKRHIANAGGSIVQLISGETK